MTTDTLEPIAASEAPADAQESTEVQATEAAPEPEHKSALDAAIAAQTRFRESKERSVATTEAAHSDTSAKEVIDEAPATTDSEDLTGRIPNDEYTALQPKTRARIKEYRARLTELDERVKGYEPKVQSLEQLQQYLQVSNLSQEDFVESLEVARLIKSDPAAAYQRMQPIIEKLQGHVGERLPEDLAQAVQEGSLSDDYAKQLARERAERTRLSGTRTERDQRDTEFRQAQQAQDTNQRTVDAVKALEATWQSTDPDYKLKSERVWERMQSIMQREGKAPTPEYITEVAKKAKQDVDAWIKQALPGRREMRPTPDANDAPHSAVAEPKSPHDAARNALHRARAGAS